MKTDMDAIRQILFEIESEETPRDVDLLKLGYPIWQLNYYIKLLVQSGLIEAEPVINVITGLNWIVTGDAITWKGHEFLDASRDNTIWEKAKNIVIKSGGSYTLEVLMQVLSDLIKQHLNIP